MQFAKSLIACCVCLLLSLRPLHAQAEVSDTNGAPILGMEQPVAALGEPHQTVPDAQRSGSKELLPFGNFFRARCLTKNYNKINDYLVAKTETSNLKENLEQALAWRADLNSKGDSRQPKLLLALNQLLSLRDLQDPKCDYQEYELLRSNEQAAGIEKQRGPSDKRPLRRIEALVNQARLDHGEKCNARYPAILSASLDQMERDKLVEVETIVTPMISARGFTTTKTGLFGVKKNENLAKDEPLTLEQLVENLSGRELSGIDLGEIVFKGIKELSVNDRKTAYLAPVLGRFYTDEFVKLVKNYLVKPCEYYVESLAQKVFIPALYDVKMVQVIEKHNFDEIKDDRYLMSFGRYAICKSIVSHGASSLIRDTFYYAEEQVDDYDL